ncbi:MAG: ADP-glyceromanno-heptose 6-epimerase [Rickettsiales bacterium]|nr:ADP-glyceromanno-heptose 6-epimerase [Rickettsiales bacterium]
MKIILIIGGAGFIGSNLAKRLADRGTHRIVIADQFGNGKKWNNLVRVPVDEIVHPENLFYWLDSYGEEVDMVYHLGGIADSAEGDVESIIESNHNFPLLVWRWCAEASVRFIYASSYEVYGDGAQGFDDTEDLDYQRKLRPLNPNGWSKKLLDMHVSGAKERDEAVPPQWVGLRLFNIYGPNEYHKKSSRSVALKIYEEASKGVPVKLFKSGNDAYADGAQMRDFMHVSDAINMLEWFLDTSDVSGTFNAGSGKAHSFEELANVIFKALGKEPNIKYVDMPTDVEGQYQYKTEATIQRLRNIGYDRPIMTMEQGITDYIQNYLKKDDPYI